MQYASMSKLFFGFFLLFFNININDLNLITTFIGVLLIVAATWQLQKVNLNFIYAFRCSIVQLVLQSASLMLFCARSNGGIATAVFLISVINGIVMFYHLFHGLSNMAEVQGHRTLEANLEFCFLLYLIVFTVIVLASFVPVLTIIAVPLALIIFIYILVQVSRLHKAIDNSENTFEERKLTLRFYGMLVLYIGFTAVLCYAVLILKNSPTVDTERYHQNDLPSSVQGDSQSIRNLMQTLGVEEEIVNDLPDSEVLKHQHALSIHCSSDKEKVDGGILEMTQCVSKFQDGNVRLLFYYKWLENPEHPYCDTISIEIPRSLIWPDTLDYTGFGLYDQKSDRGLTTYRADFLQEGIPSRFGHCEMEYRVFPKDTIHQRGFFAVDALLTHPHMALNYNTYVTYSHQKSVFHFDHAREKDGFQEELFPSNPNAFDQFYFIFEDQYTPQ